jgi:hypothetical protein
MNPKCPLCSLGEVNEDIKICSLHQQELLETVPTDCEIKLINEFCNN